MKYTVVIEQPVPEEMRPQLQQLLAERFSLTPDQAQKLAARKGGRLMKPTNPERAGILLEIYQEIGGHVHLEEVDENAPAAPTPSAIPSVQPVVSSAAPSLHATEFDQDALTLGGSGLGGATGSSEPRRIVATASPESGGVSLSSSMPAEWSTPSGGDFWSSMAGTGGELQGSSLEGSSLGGSSLGGSEMVGSSVQKPVELSELASSNLDTGWADFSSLSVGGQSEAPAPITEAPAPDTVLQTETIPTTAPAPEPHLAQRQPLAQRLTLPVMVPLALLTALSLLTAGLSLQKAQSAMQSNNARVVASTIGQTLSSDRKAAAAQLESLVKDDNGADFVQVQYPDGTTIARGRDAAATSATSKWLGSNAAGGNYGAYQVQQVGVYGDGAGRSIKPVSSDKSGLLYRVAVGTPARGSSPWLTLLPLLLGGLLSMALGYWLAQQAAQRIVQPINRLVQAADAISMGDLRQSVTPEANDEVGDLAQALERMRLSLDAAMERLRRRRAKG